MAVTAGQIMDRVQKIVLDETGVRWTLSELRLWVDDAQREVVSQKPSALSDNVVIPMVAGTLQSIPSGYTQFLRPVRNITSAIGVSPRTAGRAVRMVSRDVLDSQQPNWHDPAFVPAKAEIKHVLYDEQDPKHFYVYPPNTGTGKIEVVVAKLPLPIALAPGADPEDLASYIQVMEVDDTYVSPLTDFVLYRAYTKDAQFAGNAQRAAAHYTQFANSLGIKIQNAVMQSPNAAAATRAS